MTRLLLRGLALATALLAASIATIQPFLGVLTLVRGEGAAPYRTLHLAAGVTLYLLAMLVAVLVPWTSVRRRRTLLGLCVAQVVFLHFQLGLGLALRDTTGLLIYHPPIGALIFLLAWLVVVLVVG